MMGARSTDRILGPPRSNSLVCWIEDLDSSGLGLSDPGQPRNRCPTNSAYEESM